MTSSINENLLWPDSTSTPGHATGPAQPSLTVLEPLPGRATGAAIIVCPGGGYMRLADHEAVPVAEWLATLGITAVLLRYRLAPHARHPALLQDGQRAIRTVRARADEWNVDPGRIGILVFRPAATWRRQRQLTSTAVIRRLQTRLNARARDPI